MKKIYILFILVICFGCIDVNAKTIYLKECEYTQEYTNWLKLSDKEKKKTTPPTMCKNIQDDRFTLTGNTIPELNSVSITDEKFDLREYNLVTSVKDQGTSSSCWAFATNASIESNLLVNGKGTYDLSEAHLELSTQDTYKYNRLTFRRTINGGGHTYHSSAYLRNNWGPVLESELPFSTYLTYLESKFDDNYAIAEDKILNTTARFDVNSITMFGDYDNSSCSTTTMKDIKEYLIENGALSAVMYMSNENGLKTHIYYDGKSYTDNQGTVVSANQPYNHAITIVGWDDTISKDNFNTNTKPTRDGAFIIKNSYGTRQMVMTMSEWKQFIYDKYKIELSLTSPSDVTDDLALRLMNQVLGGDVELVVEDGIIYAIVGENGYQYISYDDVRICSSLSGFFNVDEEVEDYTYGYDDLGMYQVLLNDEQKIIYLANIFEKKSAKPEELKEINMFFAAVGQKYEVYFADKETKSVSSAKLVASGVSKFVGYNTIKIESEIITNNKYSIIIKLEDANGISFGVSSGGSILEKYGEMKYQSNVQFISFDGTDFGDVTQLTSLGYQFHLLVRTYTDEIDDAGSDDGNDDSGSTNTPEGGDDNEGETNNPEGGDNNEGGTNNPEGGDNNEGETNNPDGGDDNEGGTNNPEGGDDNKEDTNTPGDDGTNDDTIIDVLPNDKNEDNLNKDDVTNPDTSDNNGYIIVAISIMFFVGIISYRKVKHLW